MNQQPIDQKPTNQVMWVVLGIVVLVVAGGIWYVVAKDNGNLNTSNGTNNTNAVVGNSNTANNSNSVAQNTNRTNVNASNMNQNNANVNSQTSTTYTNSTWQYSFRYPSSLHVQDNTRFNTNTYQAKLLSNIVVSGVPEGDSYLIVDVVDDSINTIKGYLEDTEHISQWSTGTVGSQTAQLGSVSYGTNSVLSYYLINWQNKVVVVSCFSESCSSVVPTFTFDTTL